MSQLEKEHRVHLDIFGAFDVHGTKQKQLELALKAIKLSEEENL